MSALRNIFNHWDNDYSSREVRLLFAERSLLIASEQLSRKTFAFANSKPGVGFAFVTRIGTQLLPCRNYASDAFSLFLSQRTGTLVEERGRCFINTPIVNCYHLIKSHFPRAFHDSADQAERLLRQSVCN